MQKSEILTNTIISTLQDYKAKDIVKIDTRKIDGCFCDFFIIAHGTSHTHLSGIVNNCEDDVFKLLNEHPSHIEGRLQAQWIVMDYGDVIVHLFLKEQRDYYNIEDFWIDGILTKYNDTI